MLERLRPRDKRELLADVSLYVGAAVLPLVIIAWLLRLWAADLSVPFAYRGDALFSQAVVKGLIETGSDFTNPALGAPGVAQFYDYPGSDALNMLALRVLGLFGLGSGAVMNVFYLAGYATIGVATAFVMRRLHVSRLSSLGVAVLFALLPYHFMRGETHLFLSMYWIVPLLLLVLVWLDSSDPPLVKQAAGGWFPFALRNRRSIAALVICAAAGACGVYYMFFGCFFLVVVGLRAALRDRSWRVALAAVALILVSAFVFAAQMIPNVVYSARHGKNPVVAARSPYEAEVYGLRITQMLLPIDNHRVPFMANKRAGYRALSPGGDAESVSALGIVGSIGFVLSISALLLGWPRSSRRRDGPPGTGEPEGPPLLGAEPVSPRLLGVLTVSAVLLGTTSGFGAVFAGVISPQIRVYDRISIFIALFALATLAVLADRFIGLRKGAAWRVIGPLVVSLVVVLGVLDQTPASLGDGLVYADAVYAADATFGRQVQAELPSGASVFQLPYLAFPETGPTFGMPDYDPFRGYVHTTGLRWSYGAMKGRPDATWQQATAALPASAMVERLRKNGFAALWVQLNGYEDGGAAIRSELTDVLGPPDVVKADELIAVWRL